MKKIAIITLNGYFNYGNRLQNFALQKTLQKMGYEVETLRIERNAKKRNNLYFILRKLYRKTKLIISNPQEKSHYNREKRFIKFTNEYINETQNLYQITEKLEHLKHEYDYFVLGSDQVWNPKMNWGSGVYFANFADSEQILSYSASFGISEIPEAKISDYTKWISKISSISVREEDGARIVEELTGRKAEVVLDPTMLLSKEEWEEVSSPAPVNSSYLLTYFLGGIPKEYEEKITKYALSNNLEIINLGDINDSVSYETGPSEFIDYIQHSDIFFTDSFHGAVFSILFEKPFIAFRRIGSESMFSRIETLLKTFNFEGRIIDNIDLSENLMDMDYSLSGKILEEQKGKSIDFLQETLLKNVSENEG